jgi:hypothetical protein
MMVVSVHLMQLLREMVRPPFVLYRASLLLMLLPRCCAGLWLCAQRFGCISISVSGVPEPTVYPKGFDVPGGRWRF